MSLMGLLGDYGSDSEDSSDNEEHQQNITSSKVTKSPTVFEPDEKLENPFGSSNNGSVIPKPSFLQEQHSSISQNVRLESSSSVFSNPFRDKEDKKKAILEQHVNMTQRQEELKMIDGKKVCWMYRKGRCRNGSKCKFAHDTDVKTENVGAREVQYDANAQISSQKSRSGAVQALSMERPLTPPPTEDEENKVVRKKRPGVGDSIIPSKKAMDFHNRVYRPT
eukprot:TRINITY_DN2387_c0_g1_i1.p1 TRINITY_DN2387_c0_g1~~TRINITY_DN2387_c0_g1_i1.p1  ORF type:complete len:222 (+),score=53.26 TRINITY_DN2387_c0_g1_i1:387-1052(+)